MKKSNNPIRSLLPLFRKESARVHLSGDASSDDNVSSVQSQIWNRNPPHQGSEPRDDIRIQGFFHDKSFDGDFLDEIIAELSELIMSEEVAVGAINVTPDFGSLTNQVDCDPQNLFDQEVLMIDDLRRDIVDPIDLFDELWPGIRDSLSLARKRCVSEFDVNNFEVSSSSDIEAGVLFCDELDEFLLDEVLLSGRRDSVDIALRRRNKK